MPRAYHAQQQRSHHSEKLPHRNWRVAPTREKLVHLREPLVRRQGSQVSMRVARGSASWLSSHGRGLGQAPPSMGFSSQEYWSGVPLPSPASVLPMNIQGCFPLGLTGLISLLSKGLSRIFFSTNSKASVIQHSAFFMQSTGQIGSCPHGH